MSKPRADVWILLGSILLALLAGMVSLPAWLELIRPYWIGLLLIYWALESPQRVGLGVAFLVGIWADVLFGTLLGEHATRLCVMVFLVLRFRARLRFSHRLSRRWRWSFCCSTTGWSRWHCAWPRAKDCPRQVSGSRRGLASSSGPCCTC